MACHLWFRSFKRISQIEKRLIILFIDILTRGRGQICIWEVNLNMQGTTGSCHPVVAQKRFYIYIYIMEMVEVEEQAVCPRGVLGPPCSIVTDHSIG